MEPKKKELFMAKEAMIHSAFEEGKEIDDMKLDLFLSNEQAMDLANRLNLILFGVRIEKGKSL